MKKAGDSLAGLTEDIDSMVQENRGALMASLENLSQFLGNLKKVVDQFDEGGTSGQDLRQMILRIKGAAESLEALSRKIEVALFDDTAPAPSRIQEVKEMVGKANRIISGIEDLSFGGKVGLYGGISGSGESDMMGDISLWVKSRSRKMGLLIGADDIGGDSKITAGLGLHGDRWEFWGGAVRGYPGAGFLLHPVGPQGPLSVIAQWWNENGGSWSLEGRYRFDESWGIFYRYLDKGDDSVGSLGFFYLF